MVKLRDGREFDPNTYDRDLRYNVYSCNYTSSHKILSVDLDNGVTPMFITCRLGRLKLCGHTAISSVYPKGEPPAYLFPVKIVWRNPTNDEVKLAKRNNEWDHFSRGGLIMEWINEAQPSSY